MLFEPGEPLLPHTVAKRLEEVEALRSREPRALEYILPEQFCPRIFMRCFRDVKADDVPEIGVKDLYPVCYVAGQGNFGKPSEGSVVLEHPFKLATSRGGLPRFDPTECKVFPEREGEHLKRKHPAPERFTRHEQASSRRADDQVKPALEKLMGAGQPPLPVVGTGHLIQEEVSGIPEPLEDLIEDIGVIGEPAVFEIDVPSALPFTFQPLEQQHEKARLATAPDTCDGDDLRL